MTLGFPLTFWGLLLVWHNQQFLRPSGFCISVTQTYLWIVMLIIGAIEFFLIVLLVATILLSIISFQGVEILRNGGSSVEAATAATIILEDSELTNAGIGSNLSFTGRVECDASIMDGQTMNVGSVGAVPGVQNPILLAKRICEKQQQKLPCGLVPPRWVVLKSWIVNFLYCEMSSGERAEYIFHHSSHQERLATILDLTTLSHCPFFHLLRWCQAMDHQTKYEFKHLIFVPSLKLIVEHDFYEKNYWMYE